jgi:hypothetical protein
MLLKHMEKRQRVLIILVSLTQQIREAKDKIDVALTNDDIEISAENRH